MDTSPDNILPSDHGTACLVGRVWNPDAAGPSLVCIRDGAILDITSTDAPTMRDLLEMDDPAAFVRGQSGASLGPVEEITANSVTHRGDAARPHMLAPFDLQAVKACGVTFAQSIIERVIEEMAKGDASQAEAIRARCMDILGSSLTSVKAGSEEAEGVKQALIEAGMWSQYLEVGIGPDAEVFTKAQPMSSVGWGADVGLHPVSEWNNPEPEIVLAVNSMGDVKGATLGNDVNLRDVEGRSALLLGKAKDNNASSAIGPFIRLFDDGYGIDDVRRAELVLEVTARTGSSFAARVQCRRSAVIRSISWRRHAGRITSIQTGSASISARCSRRCRTAAPRGPASPMKSATRCGSSSHGWERCRTGSACRQTARPGVLAHRL